MLKINEELYRTHSENVISLSVNLDYSSRFIWKQEQQNNYKVTERYEYSVNFTSTRYNFIYSTENRLFLWGQSPTSYSPNFCKLFLQTMTNHGHSHRWLKMGLKLSALQSQHTQKPKLWLQKCKSLQLLLMQNGIFSEQAKN